MDLKYYKDKRRKGVERRACGSTKIYPCLGLYGAVKQTESKREHRQTFTDAHCDFFCMTGGTYRKLQWGQRADGAFEVGG